jgi:hypothetical protein
MAGNVSRIGRKEAAVIYVARKQFEWNPITGK